MNDSEMRLIRHRLAEKDLAASTTGAPLEGVLSNHHRLEMQRLSQAGRGYSAMWPSDLSKNLDPVLRHHLRLKTQD